MIYLLEQKNGISEYSYSDPINGLVELYDAITGYGSSCTLLYKFKLSKKIEYMNKFGINIPERVDYSKLKEDYFILYHLTTWIFNIDAFKGLLEFCQKNNKDLIIPYTKNTRDFRSSKRTLSTIYEYNMFLKVIENNETMKIIDIKSMSRDIKIKSLLS